MLYEFLLISKRNNKYTLISSALKNDFFAKIPFILNEAELSSYNFFK